MVAKKYLEQYGVMQNRADDLLDRYHELREQYDTVNSFLSSEGHGSGISKPTEYKVEKAQTMYEKWQIATLEAVEIRQEMFDVLLKIAYDDIDAFRVLCDRYIGLKAWQDICLSLGYSRSQLYQHHNSGLRMVQLILDERGQSAS